MTVREMLQVKGSEVITTTSKASVRDAMRLLVQHNIGALVVRDGAELGILSERDLLRTAAADPARLETARVGDLMTRPIITCTPDEELREVMDTMTEHRIRHLPIVDDAGLCGIISIGDVVNALRRDAEDQNRYLQAYIKGTPL